MKVKWSDLHLDFSGTEKTGLVEVYHRPTRRTFYLHESLTMTEAITEITSLLSKQTLESNTHDDVQ
jgi:hypothetical protein